MRIIYHIVTIESWERQLNSDYYVHESLVHEGFIHASRRSQVDGVLDRYYKNINNLYRLSIDVNLLDKSTELKEELAASTGEKFPHLYGPINKSAIVEVVKIK